MPGFRPLPLLALVALAWLGWGQHALAQGKDKPAPEQSPQAKENLCLTCPRPEPACWMVVYHWRDYNLKAGLGTAVVVTDGPPPSPQDKEKARINIQRGLGKEYSVEVKKSDRIACPKGARAGS